MAPWSADESRHHNLQHLLDRDAGVTSDRRH
jgi:hypothetical protein